MDRQGKRKKGIGYGQAGGRKGVSLNMDVQREEKEGH